MFLKKIGKKVIFAIRRKKAIFLDFYSQALLRPHLNSISFNHAAERQHEHIILVISFYIVYTIL